MTSMNVLQFKVVISDLLACACLCTSIFCVDSSLTVPCTDVSFHTELKPVVIFVLGQSNAYGYAPRLPGTVKTLPESVTLVKNGRHIKEFEVNRTGIESGLISQLTTSGIAPLLIVTAATGGADIDWVMTHDFPSLVNFANTTDVTPDVIVFIHGEADSWTTPAAERYYDKVFSEQKDSLFSKIKAENWSDAMIFVTEVRVSDSTLGISHNVVRATQHWGCLKYNNCTLVQTDSYELQHDRLHYTSESFYKLGWEIGTQIQTALRVQDNVTWKQSTVKMSSK